MDRYAIVKNNIPHPLEGQQEIVDFDGNQHSIDILILWNENELNNIGVYKIQNDNTLIPLGKKIINKVLSFDGNVVKEEYVLGDVDIEEFKKVKINNIAHERFLFETGGINVNGHEIQTDRNSQAMINGAFSLSKENPNVIVNFKTKNGFIAIDAQEISTIAISVATHVQDAFNREYIAVAAIENATNFEDIDNIEF